MTPTLKISKIHENVLDCIGKTPIIRLNKIPAEENIYCEIVAKCEYFNAGGSIKDRIAKKMIEAAEANGTLKSGDTIIEPTSGNTGIGLALAGAVKGYKVIITMPEKMSQEKVNLLKALGAQVIRTPTEASSDSPDSHISVARKLNQNIPNSIILDQYNNPNNPLAHYEGTAEEIVSDCHDHLDMVVIGAGTGGTITGVAKKLKEKYPGIVVIGVDPIGSVLADPSNMEISNQPYQVEGIGYDFIPSVLDRSLIDSWITTNDYNSFNTARRLIRSEGLLCGGSSGSIMWAAIQAIKAHKYDNDPTKRVLIILPDSIRNYMSKFLSPNWLFQHQFIELNDFLIEEKYKSIHIKNQLYSNTEKTISVATIKSTNTMNHILELLSESNEPLQDLAIINPLTNEIVGKFDTRKLFQSIFKEGKSSVLSWDMARFINKDYFLRELTDDMNFILAAFSTGSPVYIIDCNGKAILNDIGQVQSINPFKLL